MSKQINEAQIINKWAPMIEQVTGLKNKERLAWTSVYAHYHMLNESATGMGGVTAPYSTLYNVPGVGNVVPASLAAMTGQQQTASAAKGSGDKWPALLPMSLQVAARTVGFDVVNVVPMPGPNGVIAYMDYVYAGGKQPFGAQPAASPATANPANFQGGTAYDKYDAPYSFKIQIDASTVKGALPDASAGTVVNFINGSETLTAKYIGKSRIDGFLMFKTGTFGTTGSNLSDIFDGTASIQFSAATTYGDTSVAVATYPSLISTLEDQVMGYAGAGQTDNDDWQGTYVDGTRLYEPMDRGTGEMQYPRALGLQVFTKFISAGTFSISVNVTQEQIMDLNRQWGIDVIGMVENGGINEISQHINKHILSRTFALGWKNAVKAYDVEGINLNLNFSSTSATTSPAFIYPDGDNSTTSTSMTVPGFQVYGTNNFENLDTAIKRLFDHILAAGNVVMQRGRRGPANFAVCNLKLATALQSNAQYGFSPMANTFTQNNGALYPVGTLAGMTVYVDPNMKYDDTRVLVGRKGAADEPGVFFCPYLMAESVKLITEGTGAPKVIIKSRYALVDAGWHPETQYLTVYFKTSSAGII
jgi:hypothetical protein